MGSMYEWSNESTCFKPKAAKTAEYKQNDMFSELNTTKRFEFIMYDHKKVKYFPSRMYTQANSCDYLDTLLFVLVGVMSVNLE
ncbi:hypothetical protein RDI58_001182 [Solanum bulbocastanum]|uniref:Uncharacterized protein n=1 Tax=Solanum bulbocastanum TaxID=147425 RepID=A0AAN8YMZ0_SOLBU